MNKFLEDLCNKKSFNFANESNENIDLYSIMNDNNNNVLNISIQENKINSYITKEDNEIVEEFEKSFDNEEELNSIIDDTVNTFDVINQIEDGTSNSEILNEIDSEESVDQNIEMLPTDALNTLLSLVPSVKDIGNTINELASLETNLELKFILSDLSNTAYSFALDLNSVIDSYDDINDIITENDVNKNEDEELEESFSLGRSKVAILNSINEIKNVIKLKDLDESYLDQYKDLVHEIIK